MNGNGAVLVRIKGVDKGIINQIGDDLADFTGETVEGEIGFDVLFNRDGSVFKRWCQGQDNFVNHIGKREFAPQGGCPVHGDLFETADQIAGTDDVAVDHRR